VTRLLSTIVIKPQIILAMAAAVKEMEKPVQENERIARLEAHVEHIQADATAIKTDVRKINDKLDALKDVLADFKAETKERFANLNTSRALDRVWWLLIAATLLGVMARGFKWI
jgi:uncharacterized protein YlxW (UPF0749 family)